MTEKPLTKSVPSSKYDIFDAQQNSLHQVGVANSVQFQELQQATSDALISLRDQL
jgi:hypothetical protein